MEFPETVLVPGGEFEMGDHIGFGAEDPKHPSDEVPIHELHIDSMYVGKYTVTTQQYCDYLNSALEQGLIEVRDGNVYAVGGSDLYCETREAVPYSRIGWNGKEFTVLDNRGRHPMVGVMWFGAVAYCNWLSSQSGYESCYDVSSWECDFSKNGFRLPTEAEWEYAACGGRYDPYCVFPWGNDPNKARANWPNSGDPYEVGSPPLTTPVDFYNGELHRKEDFGWPGDQETYQTLDGSNDYGLYDMAGNVWQFCHDWYNRDYYANCSHDNPRGPEKGNPMPDGKPYRVMRGGNWFNGVYGWSRVANRDPSYYRGQLDPNHPWYHVGLRVVRNAQ